MASGEDRLLRLKRPGAAPVSLFLHASALPVLAVELPPAVAGGELYVRLPARAVRPVALRLEGPGGVSRLEPDSTGRVLLRGLFEGRYRLTALYRGGVEGAPSDVSIRTGETTEVLPLRGEPIGGLVLAADPALCESTSALLVVTRLEGTRSVTYHPVLRAPQPPVGCEWWIEGLVPGRYEAALRTTGGDEGLLAATTVDIDDDRLTPAWLHAPTVLVEGRVTLGGAPSDRAVTLVFARRAGSAVQEWSVTTDDSGRYRLAVGDPGSYAVQVKTRKHLSTTYQTVRLREGTQTFDLDLPGGRITIRVRRQDGARIDEPVQISLRGSTRSVGEFVLPSEGFEVDFFGLEPGEYAITAETSSGLVSAQPARVVLTRDTPRAERVVTLLELRGTLFLRSVHSEPVAGAQIQAGPRLLPETAPGAYSLTSVPPGERLLISAPGYVPVCRILRASDLPSLELSLWRGGATAVLRFSPPPRAPVGELWGLPESDCGVPLWLLGAEARRNGDALVVHLHGLPAGVFHYRARPDAPAHEVLVPGPDVPVRLASPVRKDH